MSTLAPERKPASVADSAFCFYDIESLSNVFTLVIYTPPSKHHKAQVALFYRIDDDQIDAQLDQAGLEEAIYRNNPGLPQCQIETFDLALPASNELLAMAMGLSDAPQVCDLDSDERSSYAALKYARPICDTDPNYDPVRHPFMVGYNSANYDTTMLACYLDKAFQEFGPEANANKKVIDQVRGIQVSGHHSQMDTAALAYQALDHRAPSITPPTAAQMREQNNVLFSDEHIKYMPGALGWNSQAAKIRQSMMRSGRHIDAARLNELQMMVSLERLLGMLGYQIKGSEKLGHDSVINTIDEFLELAAYNVSDCLGLSQLFMNPTYANNFDLKSGLMYQYSETRFAANGTTVRRDRLTIDSSSAKFVGRILAPTKHLNDAETVSFTYPHPDIAAERGIEPVNVLQESLKFFEEQVVPDRDTNPDQAAAHAQFMEVYNYYASIEGQNFNNSDEYRAKWPNGPEARELKYLPKKPNNIPYFRQDGSASSCFVTFSTGGIHGAESDQAVYAQEMNDHQRASAMLQLAQLYFPNASDYVRAAKDQHNTLHLPDGSQVDKRLVLLGSDPEKVKYRKPKKDDPIQAEQLNRAQAQVPDPAQLLATQRPADQALNLWVANPQNPQQGIELIGKQILLATSEARASYRQGPARELPQMFTPKADGSNKLHPNYVHTSAGLVVHEDFTSYYPNLLRNMKAFYNPELGEDRYATIFFEKERLGREMKQPGISPEWRERLDNLRNGTKLILNAASGAGDASHNNPIRMNNQIIAMRIIGQLFSWRIGQAQTLQGARIISTNTDGLYSVVEGGQHGIDEQTNNRILAEQQEAIGIDIEPELMFLISKDSNNRLELEAPTADKPLSECKILAAGGGTLACHKGPNPTKSLAHPAVIDKTLAQYLQITAQRGEAALSEPFDPQLGRRLISEALDLENPVQTAGLFQNMIAASRGSMTYPFAADPFYEQVRQDPATHVAGGTGAETEMQVLNPRVLQSVNRVFAVKDGTPGAVSLHMAAAPKVSDAIMQKRKEKSAGPEATTGTNRQINEVAKMILEAKGHCLSKLEADRSNMTQIPAGRDVAVRKINGINPKWSMVINNEDLHALPEDQLRELLASLNLDIYVQMLDETFTNNWKNRI